MSGRYCRMSFLQDVFFAERDVFQDGAEVERHFDEPHEGEVSVVFDDNAALRFHQVAAPAAELRFGVAGCNLFQQIGGVEVAGGFASYNVVFHFQLVVIAFHYSATFGFRLKLFSPTFSEKMWEYCAMERSPISVRA